MVSVYVGNVGDNKAGVGFVGVWGGGGDDSAEVSELKALGEFLELKETSGYLEGANETDRGEWATFGTLQNHG